MKPREREQLQQFLEQLITARISGRDSEAEQLIREACARQPDAAYLLVQRALLQEQALRNAQDEIARLRNQPSGGSFFGANSWGNHPASPAAAVPPSPAAAPAPGAGSWLGNLASTAAGVAAGAFLFQGIENLFGHHASPQGFLESAAQTSPPQETIVNNFFGDSRNGLASLDDGLDDAADEPDSWI